MTPCKSRSVLALFVLAFVPSACGSPGAAGTRESPAVEDVSDAGSDAMGVAFVPRIGAVLSADIAVPDHEREVRFYSRVLGTGDDPLWREDLLNNMGMAIIGLGAAVPEYAHLPLHWMPHIQVADVAASAQRAVDLGGSVLMQAEEGEAGGPWAVLLDPNQAAFGIIPVLPPEVCRPSDLSTQDLGGSVSLLCRRPRYCGPVRVRRADGPVVSAFAPAAGGRTGSLPLGRSADLEYRW